MVVAGVLAGAAALAMLTGGGAAPAGSADAGNAPAANAPAGNGSAGNAPAGVYWQRVHARFAPPTAFLPSSAVTYDMKLVPAASRIEVEQSTDPSGTRVTARLAGLKSGHAFGMRVHTGPCGSTPGAAGPRYLRSTDGRKAGPGDEMRLDFTTDAEGAATVTARRGWNFRPGGARSVVIDGVRGGAADPVACYTVPFGPTGPAA
ncbi:superoxide dismutase family protein [Streptomyces sp. SID10853]|uniref:superoxide dismutase family protein n=1 Tax=Streptomyces sp. SID10853 TaxID=2706028 RepID=UPI0013C1FEEF|nr:superoxide dismutase family protein [Streptomyces sp. SID10853]NDZ80612.1 superoxide dismutase family protein [Streptomyces sp. SID10853]